MRCLDSGCAAVELRDGFASQQSGRMHAGAEVLHHDVVPGSGTAGPAGTTGSVRLVLQDGVHRYELTYELGDA
ncbi:DUF3224 domain-containing protein [Quadrisphaera sp. KR29]|uniref:DUF3224 domain-containing protein n=1 Tax=Quadrisphaera sp. KR29 TaxID=3461391 RepID=UPI004044B426